MVSSYVGENKEFERQYLSGELEVELVPQVIYINYIGRKAKMCWSRNTCIFHAYWSKYTSSSGWYANQI